MSDTHASTAGDRPRLDLARLAEVSAYGAIAAYAVVLYAALGYLAYSLVAWYLEARGIT